MKPMLGISLLLSVTVLLAGCKLAVIIVEGGEVQSTGSGTCVAGAICIVDVNDPNFAEVFRAVPNKGWYFQKWNSGDRLFCGGSSEPICRLSFEGHEESQVVEEMVASSELFYLMPVFKPYQDIITVNGIEWLQPALFVGLSWNEINAVCPAGVCGDSGTLNGHDMTGWTWASIDDVKTLLNVYIGDNVLNSETNFHQDLDGLATNRFFEAGWQPTYVGPVLDSMTTEWRVILKDEEPHSSSSFDAGTAYVARFYEMDFSAFEEIGLPLRGELQGASFSVRLEELEDDDSTPRGAVFYR